MPRITVVMPVYNSEKYISETINSILNQTYSDFQLLLINDASTDNSLKIINEFKDKRIKLIKNPKNLGIAETRNIGIELSTTEFIALMDDDDIAPAYRFEKEIEFLDDNLDIDVVGGRMKKIDANGNVLHYTGNVFMNPKYIKAHLLLGNIIANGTTMFRKEFIDKYNIRYRNNCFGAEDYQFWVECSIHGKIANLDEVLLYWRTGHNNETNRVLKNHINEREKFIESIHNYALIQLGFRLNKEELIILNKVFKEEGIIENEDELKRLYNALKNIARQSKELKLDNSNEIITMCRKRFGEKVGKAFYLWNNL